MAVEKNSSHGKDQRDTLLQCLDQFANLRVLVIGEAMLDRYLQGEANRSCQETPSPAMTISGCQNLPGGAANTAANLQSLASNVTLLSVVGNDLEAEWLRQALRDRAIALAGILPQLGRQTLVKNRLMNGSNLLMRFDQGSPEPINAQTEQRLIEQLTVHFAVSDAVVISDYGYGVLTPQVRQAIAQLQTSHAKPLIVDAKNLAAYQTMGVTAVKPNYQQVLQLLGGLEGAADRSRLAYIQRQAPRILELTAAPVTTVTLDAEGVVLLQRDQPLAFIPAVPAQPTQTIGAGDTFTAVLALALAAAATPLTATQLAAAAAAIAVTKDGTATCTSQELRTYLTAKATLQPLSI